MWLKEVLQVIWTAMGAACLVFIGVGIVLSIIAIFIRFIQHLM